MIGFPVNELGQRRPSFTRPDLPAPEVVGKCGKCGGGTRAEEYDSWSGGQYARKRTYRCIQHGTRCPAHTVIVGQEGQEEKTMAKTVTCTQTQAWCDETKAAMLAKHLAYKDVARDAAISCSALAQGLTLRMSLAEDTQARIMAAIAKADPVEALAARTKAASRKPKAAKAQLPGSLQGPPSEKVTAWAAEMEKETQDRLMSNLKAREALPPDAVVTWSEEQPRPGLLQTEMLEHNAENLSAALGTGAVRPPVCRCLKPALEAGGLCPECLAREKQAKDLFQLFDTKLENLTECRFRALADNHNDLEQRHSALETRVQGVAERTQDRLNELCDQHRAGMAALEDRLAQNYDHLTESMANMQPLVVTPPPETSNWTFCYPPTGPSLDEVVNALSKYTDAQLASMVAAAAARREMLKAMEAA